MIVLNRRHLGALALALAGTSSLAACSQGSDTGASGAPSSANEAQAGGTKEVTDARGTVSVPVNPTAIAATDNRIFRTLESWGVTLVAAPQDLIAEGISYKTDTAILNTGTHREPDLEKFVAANPDLVLNGQRYADHYEAIQELVPDAALVDTDIDTSTPLDEELSRQITLVGEVLNHQDDATTLINEFTAAIERAKAAYSPELTVMGVITSGGDINYAAPVTGRAVGPLFPLLGLTPAIETEGTTDHQGDDISVEAVAHSNPDWIIVMDRDAAVASDEPEYQPAAELIEKSEALSNVTAIKEQQVIYMPNNFYVTEDIQAYTEFLTTFADALEK